MSSDQPEWIDDSQKAISIGFIEYFKLIEDPKQSRKTGHNLFEIIFISVCAYICGANSWECKGGLEALSSPCGSC